MKRFLRITQEAAFGTFPGSPTSIYVRLPTANPFKVMTSPQYWQIMSGSGFAVPALTGTQTTGLAATLSIPLDFDQAQFLLSWAGVRINSGQTLPWTTTELAGDLASCAIDYAWTNFDGTLRTKRFLGCKINQWSLSANKDSPVVQLSLQIVASTPQGNSYDASSDPTLTAPADSSFPVKPVLFQHLRGGFTVGSSRTNFQSVNISVDNAVNAYFDESRFANAIRFGGRKTTVGTRFRLKATPDDRAAWENATVQALQLVFSGYSKSITMNLNGQNYFSKIDEDFPPDQEVYYDAELTNYLDTTATTDFTLAFT